MEQTRQDDLLGHAGLHRARRALKHVIRRREAEPEEVVQRRLVGHLLEDLHVAAAGGEDRARAAAERPRFDLGLDLGDRREFFGLLGSDAGVQLLFHVMLERVCLRLMIHEVDGRHAAETGNEGSSIDLHADLL